MTRDTRTIDTGGYGKAVEFPTVPIRFAVQLLDKYPDGAYTEAQRKDMREKLLFLADALTAVNVIYLKSHPKTPSIYDPKQDIRYRAEEGTEDWEDIPTIIQLKLGDCEDLACARAAELRQDGIRANPWVSWVEIQGRYLYHMRTWRNKIGTNMPPYETVVRANGQRQPVIIRAPAPWGGYIEDPSLVLGM